MPFSWLVSLIDARWLVEDAVVAAEAKDIIPVDYSNMLNDR